MLGLSISIGLVGHLLGGSFLISLFYLKLKHKLLPGERLVEDGGYIGDTKLQDPDEYSRDKINCVTKTLANLVRVTRQSMFALKL